MQFKQLFPPTYDGTCYIEITHRCNYSCKHCYAKCPQNSEMSFESIKKLAKILKKYKFRKVLLTGGEPLLVKHLGKTINLLAKDFKVILITNAVLIEEKFEEIKKWKFYGAYVSLDGPTEKEYKLLRGKNGLEKAKRGIKLLRSIGKPVNVGIVLTKYNVDKIENFIKEISDLGVSGINLSLAQPFGRTLENKELMINPEEYAEKYLPKLIEMQQKNPRLHFESVLCFPESMRNTSQKISKLNLFEKYISGCAAGKKFIYIRPDGYVIPCGYVTADNDLIKETGNIFRQSLEEIYQTPLFKFFMRRSWESVTGKCTKCNYSVICKGGCPFRSYYLKNSLVAPDPWCLNEPEERGYLQPQGVNEDNFHKSEEIVSF